MLWNKRPTHIRYTIISYTRLCSVIFCISNTPSIHNLIKIIHPTDNNHIAFKNPPIPLHSQLTQTQ